MKSKLRKQAIETRKQLDSERASKRIMEKLFALDEYADSKKIICYYPLPDEISDIECINDKAKMIYLPRVNGDNLEICPYEPDKIKCGSYKILEPETDCINNFDDIDMVIIPCVAADKKGYRIGYGKGYYDRLLKNLPDKVLKVILVYSALCFNNVFPEYFDVKADIVITEDCIYRV